MPIYYGGECLRGGNNCEAISQIQSDCKTSFACCGFNDPKSRKITDDKFRLCWKTKFTDEMGDYDRKDMQDTITVMSHTLSVDNHKNDSLP